MLISSFVGPLHLIDPVRCSGGIGSSNRAMSPDLFPLVFEVGCRPLSRDGIFILVHEDHVVFAEQSIDVFELPVGCLGMFCQLIVFRGV